jgi:hypothetical protein
MDMRSRLAYVYACTHPSDTTRIQDYGIKSCDSYNSLHIPTLSVGNIFEETTDPVMLGDGCLDVRPLR